jgi:Arc/MetJ-type ribon-helix-helix transcriptional regulator
MRGIADDGEEESDAQLHPDPDVATARWAAKASVVNDLLRLSGISPSKCPTISTVRIRVPGMMINHTIGATMASIKVAITLEQDTLRQVDSLVARGVFRNRSRAIQTALQEKLERMGGGRLAAECAKLDPAFEQQLAEEGLGADAATWRES